MALVSGVSTTDDQPTERSTIKERIRRKGKKRRFELMTGSVNPIREEIKDPEYYRIFFKNFGNIFIPFAGANNYTSQALLDFLLRLKDLSTTKAGITGAKFDYALSGKIKITRSYDPDYDLGGIEEVGPAQARQVYDVVKGLQLYGPGGQRKSIKEFLEIRNAFLESCGNFYYLISKAQVLSEKAFSVRIVRPNEVLYTITPEGEPKVVGVSKIWSEDYVRRNPVKFYSVYPDFSSVEDGLETAMVHEKLGSGNWYGRPRDLSCIPYQYLEWQNIDALNKDTESKFTGRVFFEVEDEDSTSGLNDEEAQKEGFDDLVDMLEESFSNKGSNPGQIIAATRPYGAKPAFVKEFTGNTNENWYQITGQIAEREILKANNWPKKFLGLSETSGLSTNEFLDVFKIGNVTVIRKIQEKAAYCINQVILKEFAEFMEDSVLPEFSLQFTSPYEEMITQAAEAEAEAEEIEQEQEDNGQSDNS